MVGVNWAIRKLAAASKPSIDINHQHPNIIIKSISAVRTNTNTFVIGEEPVQREHDMAGLAWHSAVLIDNSVTVRVKSDKIDLTQCYRLGADGGLEMVMTLIKDGETLVLHRYFVRVESS